MTELAQGGKHELVKRAKGKGFRQFADIWWGYAFISPWLLGLFVLTVGPMTQSFYLSLTKYNLLELPVWIGAGNYTEIFIEDDNFLQALKVTFTIRKLQQKCLVSNQRVTLQSNNS